MELVRIINNNNNNNNNNVSVEFFFSLDNSGLGFRGVDFSSLSYLEHGSDNNLMAYPCKLKVVE